MDQNQRTNPPSNTSPSPTIFNPPNQITTLPLEIQLQIISHLPYPDALSLKLTCRHFHSLTSSSTSLTVISRVTWLLSRAQLKLPIPKSSQMRLHNDAMFLGNREVQTILRRRRKHEECAEVWRDLKGGEEWPGCLIVPGVRLCDDGVRVLEGKLGGRRPIWNDECGGGMVYISERMLKDWEVWRRENGRRTPGEVVRAYYALVVEIVRSFANRHGMSEAQVYAAFLAVVLAVWIAGGSL